MGIGRLHHRHVGEGANDTDIFRPLVGHTVAAHMETAVAGDHFDVEIRIADHRSELLTSPHRGKDRVGVRDDRLPDGGQSRGCGHQVLLRDAEVDVPMGVLPLEGGGEHGLAQISPQDHKVLPFRPQGQEGFAKGFPCGHRFRHAISPLLSSSSSAMACLNWSSLGAAPCQPT